MWKSSSNFIPHNDEFEAFACDYQLLNGDNISTFHNCAENEALLERFLKPLIFDKYVYTGVQPNTRVHGKTAAL